MIGFSKINKILFPYQKIKEAYEHMRQVGLQGLEGVALFAGKEVEDKFIVQQTLIPRQTALSLEAGLLYAVGGDELHRLNVYLYEQGLSLIAQIHSHPGRAYHSTTDDAYPIITTVGGISIVVPHFAREDISMDSWAVYRLSSDNYWKELGVEVKNSLIIVTDK